MRELRREIIVANGSLPDRGYTYPFKVMVIRYRNGASRIVFPCSDRTRKEGEFNVTRWCAFNLQRGNKCRSWPIKNISPAEVGK